MTMITVEALPYNIFKWEYAHFSAVSPEVLVRDTWNRLTKRQRHGWAATCHSVSAVICKKSSLWWKGTYEKQNSSRRDCIEAKNIEQLSGNSSSPAMSQDSLDSFDQVGMSATECQVAYKPHLWLPWCNNTWNTLLAHDLKIKTEY